MAILEEVVVLEEAVLQQRPDLINDEVVQRKLVGHRVQALRRGCQEPTEEELQGLLSAPAADHCLLPGLLAILCLLRRLRRLRRSPRMLQEPIDGPVPRRLLLLQKSEDGGLVLPCLVHVPLEAAREVRSGSHKGLDGDLQIKALQVEVVEQVGIREGHDAPRLEDDFAAAGKDGSVEGVLPQERRVVARSKSAALALDDLFQHGVVQGCYPALLNRKASAQSEPRLGVLFRLSGRGRTLVGRASGQGLASIL
eukprot:scaffold1809_cov228-Pinguiococcus_pyrenoidosus.AAC.10